MPIEKMILEALDVLPPNVPSPHRKIISTWKRGKSIFAKIEMFDGVVSVVECRKCGMYWTHQWHHDDIVFWNGDSWRRQESPMVQTVF